MPTYEAIEKSIVIILTSKEKIKKHSIKSGKMEYLLLFE